MKNKNNKLKHGKKKPSTHRFHVVMPWTVVKELRWEAVNKGISVAWILTEMAMERYNLSRADLESEGHESPPQYFKDRVGQWTSNKKKKKNTDTSPEEETASDSTDDQTEKLVCPGCGKARGETENDIERLKKTGLDSIILCRGCGREDQLSSWLV